MRYLLGANLIYALVLPVIEIFVGAYIIGQTGDPTLFVKYQLAVYTGIPLVFVLNGFLLRRIRIARLYALGVLLSGVSMTVMMGLEELSMAGILPAGLIMGGSYGFFWANRDYMSLDVTNDQSRNYYFGLDTLFYTLTFIVVPATVGYLITLGDTHGYYSRREAFVMITAAVFVLTLLATWIITRVEFRNPDSSRFLYLRFDAMWWKMAAFAGCKGIMQGAIMIFPTMLILSFLKTEASLGALTSIGGMVSAVILYLIGRYARPQHRMAIYLVSIVLFSAGILVHSVAFSISGVVVYQILTYMARPLHDVSYFPVEFKIIDRVVAKEQRSEFTYILHHEFALYLGRIAGCLLFLAFVWLFSVETALRYGLLLTGAIMMGSLWLMSYLNGVEVSSRPIN